MPMTQSPVVCMKGVHGRADVSEVARVADDLDVVVGGGQLLQDGEGVVAGGVVNEDVLVTVVGRGGDRRRARARRARAR